MHLKIFGRHPLMWLASIQAVFAVLVTIPQVQEWGFTEVMAATSMTVISGLFAVLDAIAARPFAIPALVGAVRTVLVGLMAFGLPLSDQTVSTIVAALAIFLALITQPNTTPAHDPAHGFLSTETVEG